MNKSTLNILGISGSLRQTSSNSVLLKTIAGMFEPPVQFSIYNGIGALPQFDDADHVPPAITGWTEELRKADGIVICSPEYAFGVPGSLKNALDWTVGTGEIVNKPLALITAATVGDKAHAAWLNIFTALSANIPEACALQIPFIRSKMDSAGHITDAATVAALQELVKRFTATLMAL